MFLVRFQTCTSGCRFWVPQLMIFGLFGVVVLRKVYSGLSHELVVLLKLAALPLLEEVCYEFVTGVQGAELLVVRALAGYIGLAMVMILMCIVLSTLLNLLFLLFYSFVGVLKSEADVLRGIWSKGFTQSRWDAWLRYWGAVCRHGPCGPISSFHPWDNWDSSGSPWLFQVGETDPTDIVFEVSGGAGRCEADTEVVVCEVSVGAERCEADSEDTVFEASGIPCLCKGSFQAMFGVSPGPVFLFHGNAGSFWIFWKWNSGEWQLGSCILLFLVRYVYCFLSSGFGHVLGLRIVASGAAMIGKFKLMIADAVFFVSSSAACGQQCGSCIGCAVCEAQQDSLCVCRFLHDEHGRLRLCSSWFPLTRVWLRRVPHISQCAQESFFCGSRSRDTTGGRGEGPASSSCACVRGCVVSGSLSLPVSKAPRLPF